MSAELAPERWSRLWELFDAARERPAGAERARFVAETSAGDAELGAELAELLAASDTAGALLDRGDRDWVAPLLDGGSEPAALGAGAAVGAWRLGALLGEGGMGSVFEAERSEGGFRQRAAVKLLRGGGLSPLLRERFLQERRILARLEHPGIARFLDGGVTADGVPWFALERVEGEPITSWCRQHLAPRRAPGRAPARGLRGGRFRPPQPRRPPRPQAVEHPGRRRRPGEAARLRDRQAARSRAAKTPRPSSAPSSGR